MYIDNSMGELVPEINIRKTRKKERTEKKIECDEHMRQSFMPSTLFQCAAFSCALCRWMLNSKEKRFSRCFCVLFRWNEAQTNWFAKINFLRWDAVCELHSALVTAWTEIREKEKNLRPSLIPVHISPSLPAPSLPRRSINYLSLWFQHTTISLLIN